VGRCTTPPQWANTAARAGDLAGLLDLDACVDATKTARELREASRATGRRRLYAFGETPGSSVLAAFTQAVEKGRSPAHHAVVYGIGLATMPERALLISWAYQSLGAICLSSPKLLRIGQNAAQRVLTSALAPADENVDQSLAVARDDLGWFDPLVEIASMHHEIAHERLFIS
jgi:urease accessory protein